MALVATTAWELRAGGSANNGAGFNNRIPGTSIDYSQQNASQLSINDLVGALASVTVTSAIGGFTNAMVGNVMRIRGGVNFTVGFYEIVQFNNANSVNLDRVPVTGAGANGLAEVGGAQINFNLLDTVVVPGNTIYVMAGTYPAHPAVTLNAQSDINYPIIIIGYNAARGDNPTGNNRPLIQMTGSFTITNPAAGAPMTKIRNINFDFSINGNNLIASENASVTIIENCKISNSFGGGAPTLFLGCVGGHNLIIDTEISGTPGFGTGIDAGANLTLINCYLHDLNKGIALGTNNGFFVFFNIFYNISIGIENTTDVNARLQNNTFSNCARGYYQTTGTLLSSTFISNSFSDCSICAIRSFGAKIKNNNFFNNALNVDGSTFGIEDNNTFVNPQFVAPGTNFALQRTSGLIDEGLSMTLGV